MAPLKHGHTRRISADGRRVDSPEYRSYTAMKNRCLNARQGRWHDYGGRGITICDRWLNGDGKTSGFGCFLRDVGPKPSAAHSLDRRDNNGHYEPENVRWALPHEQSRNARSNRLIGVAGIEVCLAEAVEMFPIVSRAAVTKRLALGWGEEEAVLTPKGSPRLPSPSVPF